MPGTTEVLVVDDEIPLAKIIASYLEREGLQVDLAADGPAAVALTREVDPSIIVLDISLPGFDGIEVCRRIREFSDAYVLMLTARDDEESLLQALGTGADDYVLKPFSPRELIARIGALQRRPRQRSAPANPESVGPLLLQPSTKKAFYSGVDLSVTPTEFSILRCLVQAHPEPVSRVELMTALWGPDWFGSEQVIDVHIGNLRRRIRAVPDHAEVIETIRSVGYRLDPMAEPK